MILQQRLQPFQVVGIKTHIPAYPLRNIGNFTPQPSYRQSENAATPPTAECRKMSGDRLYSS